MRKKATRMEAIGDGCFETEDAKRDSEVDDLLFCSEKLAGAEPDNSSAVFEEALNVLSDQISQVRYEKVKEKMIMKSQYWTTVTPMNCTFIH